MSLPASTSGSLIPSGSPLCVTLHLDPSLLKRSSRHPRAETPLRVSLPASCASKTSKADAFHAVASGQIAALKRAAAAAVSVPEHMLRIRPHISSNNKASSTAAPVPEPDSVELDLSQPLSLSLRSSRSATTTIVIRSFAESKLDENWTIKVDLSDTSLDLKFLLLPLLQATYAKKNQSDCEFAGSEPILMQTAMRRVRMQYNCMLTLDFQCCLLTLCLAVQSDRRMPKTSFSTIGAKDNSVASACQIMPRWHRNQSTRLLYCVCNTSIRVLNWVTDQCIAVQWHCSSTTRPMCEIWAHHSAPLRDASRARIVWVCDVSCPTGRAVHTFGKRIAKCRIE